MTLFVVHDPPAHADREAFRETMGAIREALRERDLWLVAGFIFFWTFSPSFGPALLYYQTDVLTFSQQFIGHLGALGSIAAVGGAVIYAPLSRRVPLTRLINFSIGVGVAGTLAYLLYRGAWSAVVINTVFGCVGMITQLAFLAVDEAIEQGLGLAVDPVQVLEHHHQRLGLALAQQQALDRIQRLLAPLERMSPWCLWLTTSDESSLDSPQTRR